MTGHGRHAAGSPPSLLLPLLALTLLLALAAGGWLLFAQPSGRQTLDLAGDSVKLPSAGSSSPSGPARPSTGKRPARPEIPPAPSATARPTAEPEPEPAPTALPELLPKSAAAALDSLTGPVVRLNWRAVAACESRNNPRAVNLAGYYGLYQFSRAAWRAVGGTGLPHHATAAEQTLRAQLLYRHVGGRWQNQWPHCGARLFTSR
ncbi:transglycosylase family protein [Actinocorallia longicatena]|uniref:transglycosylase family protein n=1 Tax=Actinocorallia longicatena TaxID=111803 RepID=UPI0031DE4CC2